MSQLQGKTVVLSGRFTQKREELKAEIEAAGGTVASKVTASTDLLVEGSRAGATARNSAEKHNVQLLDFVTFQTLLSGAEAAPADAAPVEEVIAEPAAAAPAFDVSGKNVAVTGKFNELNRKEITLELERRGAKVASSVTKKTAYLIAGERAGSKLAKAENLGIPVLNEADFQQILAMEATVEVEEKKPKPVVLPPLMEGKELPMFKGKVVCITGKFDHFKKKHLETVLTTSGAKLTSSVNSKTTTIISGRDWGRKLREGIAKDLTVWTEGEILLALEGRDLDFHKQPENLPLGVNLDAMKSIQRGSTVITTPKGVKGELVLKWKRVPFKISRRFCEEFGMVYANMDNTAVGRLYYNGEELAPDTEEFYGPETYRMSRFWEDGCDYHDEAIEGDGTHGFNCSAFTLGSRLVARWSKNGRDGCYRYEFDCPQTWYGDFCIVIENIWLSVDFERKTYAFTHHMGPYVVAPHDPWGQ